MQKLAVYLDSYNSEPFVTDIDDENHLTSSAERKLTTWLQLVTGKAVDLEKNLKIEDVRRPAEHYAATRLRIKLV